MSLPLTRAQLDSMVCRCGQCRDNTLFLNARCHPSGGTEVQYDKKTGILSIRCKRCNAPVVKIKVASELIEA